MRFSIRILAVAAMFALMALLLGCSRDKSAEVVFVTTTSTAAIPDAEEEIIAAWNAFWEAYLPMELNRVSEPDFAPVEGYITESLLNQLKVAFALNTASGAVLVEVDGKVREVDDEPEVSVAGTTATLNVCWFDYAEEFDSSGLQVSPPGVQHTRYTGSFIYDETSWRLNEIQSEPCV